MEVSGQLHASAALPARKEPRYPLGGPKSSFGRCREEKNLALPGIETREAQPAVRMSYPDSIALIIVIIFYYYLRLSIPTNWNAYKEICSPLPQQVFSKHSLSLR
jgi:hypothetical protein